MNEPSVSVRNLTKSFSGRTVVDDLSFDVQKGQVFALPGHNGADRQPEARLSYGRAAAGYDLHVSIGLMVASLCRTTKAMNAATSLLYFPMPLGMGIRLLKSVSMGCYDRITVPVITLIAITVICGTVAVKTFRWE